MPDRNLLLLFAGQWIFVTGMVLMVTMAGIVGSELTSDPALTTLPASLLIVGTALAAVPAALLMQRIGRRAGSMLAAANAGVGALVGITALERGSFVLFSIAALLIGITAAFSQQLRFAAAESVPAERVGWAVSFILLGSIGGAILGPELAMRSPQWTAAVPFAGALWAMCGLYALAFVLFAFLRIPPPSADPATAGAPRPWGELLRNPRFVVAVTAGVVGQGVMAFIMTATPVSMHVVDGHSLADTADVIRAHVLAMYLPSLVSGWLIARLGVQRMMQAGVAILVATLAAGLMGQHVLHYGIAMVLLGIGWNFLYVGGTTMLVTAYRPSERFRAQAFNEFSVFGISALASLSAGAVIHLFGWFAVLLASALPLLVMAGLLVAFRRASAAGGAG